MNVFNNTIKDVYIGIPKDSYILFLTILNNFVLNILAIQDANKNTSLTAINITLI